MATTLGLRDTAAHTHLHKKRQGSSGKLLIPLLLRSLHPFLTAPEASRNTPRSKRPHNTVNGYQRLATQKTFLLSQLVMSEASVWKLGYIGLHCITIRLQSHTHTHRFRWLLHNVMTGAARLPTDSTAKKERRRALPVAL